MTFTAKCTVDKCGRKSYLLASIKYAEGERSTLSFAPENWPKLEHYIAACENGTDYSNDDDWYESNGGATMSVRNGKIHFEVEKSGSGGGGNMDFSGPANEAVNALREISAKIAEIKAINKAANGGETDSSDSDRGSESD